MSEGLIVGLISALVSLVGIFVSAKATQNSLMHKIDTNQQIMNNDLSHLKTEMSEMKQDIKAHNHYAQLFNENVPVIQEKISVANNRIKDLEVEVRDLRNNNH